jgi:NTP pyrophosphatase (non-canonical NTP hydrolase)
MPSSKTIGQMQLDNFVDAIPRIYCEKDEKRSIWDVWMHANHHASAIGEEVRKGTSGRELFTEIADFAMWLFTAVNKFQGDIGVAKSPDSEQESLIRIAHDYSDLLWNKYPGMCPVCYWRRVMGDRSREKDPGFEEPCDCLLHDVETRDQMQKRHHTKALRAFSWDQRRNKPQEIDRWQGMFARMFAANLRHLSLTSIAFHLLEEMGEVSDAMVRMYTYSEENFVQGEPSWRQVWLEDELADVSSWLFALVEKLDTIRQTANEYDRWRFGTGLQDNRITLSQIIWKRYGSDDLEDFICPHPPAQQHTCRCPLILVPADRSVQDVRDKVMDILGS